MFAAANVDTAVVVFREGTPTQLTVCEICNKEESFCESVDLSLISPPAHIIQISLLKDHRSAETLKKITLSSQPLGTYCRVSTGLKAYQTGKGKPPQSDRQKAGRVFHATHKREQTYGPYLLGADVCRYYLAWSGQYLSYGEWLAEPRRSVPFDGERLLVRQIPTTPPYMVHAVFTDAPFYNDINSMVVFSPVKQVSVKFLLALVNSRLLSFWFGKTFDKLQRRIFPQFKVKELAQFPVRDIDFSHGSGKSRHNRMVDLVERMLSLHKELRSAKTAHDKTVLQRQIETTDRQIDRLVYELYGVTDEEIAIVEEATRSQ